MTTDPPTLRRDACPGVVEAMAAADGMLMRVLLPGGAISGRQLETVAAVGAAHGNGRVEITARANLQIRGIDTDRVAAAAEALIGAGLADRDPALNARRAIVAPALAGHDPLAPVDVTPFLAAITRRLRAARLPGTLPAKFSIVVDDGSPRGVADVAGHLVIRVLPSDATVPNDATLLKDAIERTAASVVDAARACTSPSHAAPPGPVRASAPRSFTGPVVGLHPHHEADRCNLIAAPPSGPLDTSQLRVLVELCRHGSLRFTHRHGLALAGVRRSDLARVIDLLGAAGLSIDPADPVHTVTACIGSPGCASSRADTLAAAATVVTDRRRGSGRHTAERVHLAGCEKGCGAPPDARLVLPDLDPVDFNPVDFNLADIDGPLEVGR